MELILWRHADAEEGRPDIERLLSEKGRRQAEKMAGFLRGRLPGNARILVSPALRAQQTVRALTSGFDIVPGLAPGASPQAALKAAGWPNGAAGSVLLVGHQPYLGGIAAMLLADLDVSFSIGTGAIWWFAYRDGVADLRMVMSPDFL